MLVLKFRYNLLELNTLIKSKAKKKTDEMKDKKKEKI